MTQAIATIIAPFALIAAIASMGQASLKNDRRHLGRCLSSCTGLAPGEGGTL